MPLSTLQCSTIQVWPYHTRPPYLIFLSFPPPLSLPPSHTHIHLQYNSTWGPILLETIVNHGECSTGVVTIGNNNTAGQGQASVTQAEGCGGAEPNPQLLSCVAEVDNGDWRTSCNRSPDAHIHTGTHTHTYTQHRYIAHIWVLKYTRTHIYVVHTQSEWGLLR